MVDNHTTDAGAKRFRRTIGLCFAVALLAAAGTAQSQDADLAQELSNPVADLITLPIQMNYDRDIGPADKGEKLTTNVQPVIPFDVNEDWNLITRTIMPVIYQDDIFPGEGSQFGLGDVNMSLFFSPKRPTAGRRRAHDARALDGRDAGQPSVVLCWRRRPPGHQQFIHTAFCRVHDTKRLDLLTKFRNQLQLENRKVVRARKRQRIQSG